MYWTQATTAILIAAWLWEGGHKTLNRSLDCAAEASMYAEIVDLCMFARMKSLQDWIVFTRSVARLKTHYRLDAHSYTPIYVERIKSGAIHIGKAKSDEFIAHKLEKKGVPYPSDVIENYHIYKWQTADEV